MNIIDALQALKDGKKIRASVWKKGAYLMACQDGMICNEKGSITEIASCNISTNKWEIYTEPLKLTPEEIKALKLARDCGFNLIQCDGTMWVSPTGKEHSWVGVQWIPSLCVLNRSNWITEGPMSINELLKDEV